MEFIIDGIAFSYDKTPILKDVSLELKNSEILGILGPNGSGKTTLMKCMNRILTPKQGQIMLNDENLLKMSRIDISKTIGYVPQNNVEELCFPTVYEVVMMGRRPYGYWRMNSDDDEIVWGAMTEMSVDSLATHRFDELSSGQTQRVLMARAIAQRAHVLLLDEPTSNLDIRYQIDVMDTVTDIMNTRGVSVCAIIHDLDLAMKYCDKAVLLHEGLIQSAGKVEEVITEDNVKNVYGVDIIIDHSYGRPHVVIP